MYILGINISHDSSCCLLKDGELIWFSEDERLFREKNDNRYEDEISHYYDFKEIRTAKFLHCDNIKKYTHNIDYVVFTSFGRTILMALSYALAQMFSRYLKELDVKLTNTYMAVTGCVSLLIFSIFAEGNSLYHFQNINFTTWLLILHSAILVSLVAHMSMFYLYKFYPVGQVMPFYSLFPIFGIIQTYFIFSEIPPLLTLIGGVIILGSVYSLQKIR